MHELNLLEIGQWDQFEPSELLPDQKNAFDQLQPAESGPFFHCCSPSSFRICMNSSPVMVSFS